MAKKVKKFDSKHRRDAFERVLEDGANVGYPMSPGNWVTGITKTPITTIKMTCGGGIGGAQWLVRVERLPFDVFQKAEGFVKVKDIDGDEKLLNARYIVDVDNSVTMMSCIFDSQNPSYAQGEYLCRWLVEDGAGVTRRDRF